MALGRLSSWTLALMLLALLLGGECRQTHVHPPNLWSISIIYPYLCQDPRNRHKGLQRQSYYQETGVLSLGVVTGKALGPKSRGNLG